MQSNAGIQYHRLFTESSALDNLDKELAINFIPQIVLVGETLLHRQSCAVIVNVTSANLI